MEWKKINRYVIYLISLFIISLGASLSIKANLGTSPLICLPYVCSLITNLSVGIVIFLFTILFIVIQIALLGKGFEKRQYLQLVIGFIFSFFVDFSLISNKPFFLIFDFFKSFIWMEFQIVFCKNVSI